MTNRKGIILAGGSGTRLYPLTKAVSKQLLPIYDKPMIYYPLTVLMLTSIREIMIITTAQDHEQFKRLLSDGSQWGIRLEYKIQPSPDGLAQAFILAEDFLDGAPSAMVLGDNVFFGHGLPEILKMSDVLEEGATVFGYHVSDPERYGVLEFEGDGRVKNIIEKPAFPPSSYAVTGLYFVDGSAPDRAKMIKPSVRGELEITSLIKTYLQEGLLRVEKMGRGFAWFDTGTHASLLEASNFVHTLTKRQGLHVGSPDEVALYMNWIDNKQLHDNAKSFANTEYGQYLLNVLDE